MPNFKVYLSEAQWQRACADEEIAAEVAKQQPELFATFAKPSHDHSPVSAKNAAEAIEQIGNMRSKEKLQHIIDNDPRVTVKDAATQRLAAIENG